MSAEAIDVPRNYYGLSGRVPEERQPEGKVVAKEDGVKESWLFLLR